MYTLASRYELTLMKVISASAIFFLAFTTLLTAQEESYETDLQFDSASLHIENLGYAKNMEGSNFAVRTPRTLFGDLLTLTLDLESGKSLFRLGGVGVKTFNEPYLKWGDYHGGNHFDSSAGRGPNEQTEYDRDVPLLQPFIQYRYRGKYNDFIFGNLEKDHPFHELIKYDVYEFLRPAETGFQLLFDKSDRFYEEFYINWELANKEDQKENFHVGSITTYKFHASSISAQAFYLHRGGGEYPQTPMVSENINVAAPIQLGTFLPGSFFRRFAIESTPMYTLDEPDRDDKGTWRNGKGAMHSLILEANHHTWKLGYWKGTDIYAEEGIPFSRSEQFLYLDYLMNFSLDRNVDLVIRFHGGAFGEDFSDSFNDQKLYVKWRGNLVFYKKNEEKQENIDTVNDFKGLTEGQKEFE